MDNEGYMDKVSLLTPRKDLVSKISKDNQILTTTFRSMTPMGQYAIDVNRTIKKDKGCTEVKIDIEGSQSAHISKEKTRINEVKDKIESPMKSMDISQPRSCYNSKFVELGNDIPLRNQNFQARSCYPSTIMDQGQELHLRNMDLQRDSYNSSKIMNHSQDPGEGRWDHQARFCSTSKNEDQDHETALKISDLQTRVSSTSKKMDLSLNLGSKRSDPQADSCSKSKVSDMSQNIPP